MIKYNFLLLVFLFSSCQMNKTRLAMDWEVAATLPTDTNNNKHIGLAGPIVGVIDNELIVAGGANFPNGMPWDGGKKTYQKEVYFYDMEADGKINYSKSLIFEDSLAYAANVSYKNKIYSAGGERNGVATSDVFSYYLVGDKLERTALTSLPMALTNGALTVVDDKLYFVGGENADLVSDKVFVYDLANQQKGWEQFAVLPNPISHSVVVYDDKGNILIIGGRKRNENSFSDIYRTVYNLTISTKTLSTLAELPEPLAAGTGVYYDGNVLVFGGDNGSTFNEVERLIAAINLSDDHVEKEELINKKNTMQRSHPGFPKKVWSMNLNDNIWAPTTDMVGDSPVTTTAVLHGNIVVIPSGEIKAGVRTNQILIGKFN